MNSPTVSVVIPFYSQHPGKLLGAVKSVLSQTLESIELIVVDDCSPVSAERELKGFSDPRVKIITHAKNLMGGLARNTGVKNAKGQFVAFLDSDDEWHSEKLQTQWDFWKNNDCSSNAVLFCSCKIIEGDRSWVRPTRNLKPSESISQYLFSSRELIQTSGLFLKREMALKNKFDDLKRHQDYQFCLELEKNDAEFYLVPDVLYEFIQTPKINDFEFSLLFLERYKDFFSKESEKGFIELVVIRSMLKQRRFKSALKMAFKYKSLVFFLDFLKFSLKSILRIKLIFMQTRNRF